MLSAGILVRTEVGLCWTGVTVRQHVINVYTPSSILFSMPPCAAERVLMLRRAVRLLELTCVTLFSRATGNVDESRALGRWTQPSLCAATLHISTVRR